MKTGIKGMSLSIILVCMAAPVLTHPGAVTSRTSSPILTDFIVLSTLTIYNPVAAQCDADPLVTASNKHINLEKLRAGNIRWMALSRDLLKRWGGQLHYGDTVILQAGDSTIDGQWIIQDTMNKRYSSHGDLLFDAATRTKGKWSNVTLSRLRNVPALSEIRFPNQ